jgi:hypothetical protein
VRKILALLALGFAVFVWVYRQRLFLRDPLGEVDRGGVKQEEARVFINYSNDVLVQDGGRWILVQGWSGAAGTPARLNCVQGLACMTEAEHAEVTPAGTKVEMSNRMVSFVDGEGHAVRVTLR